MLNLLASLSVAILPPVDASSAEGLLTGKGGDRFGYQVDSGDLNGDGETDVVVSAPHQIGGNAVYVFFGPIDLATKPTLDYADADVVIEGVGGSEAGWSIAIGDLLGGPEDDLIVASPSESAPDGRVHVFAGPLTSGVTLPTAAASASITGHQGGYSGWSVTAGDFDGDGRDELAVGACYVGALAQGAAYLLDLDGGVVPTSTTDATTTFEGSGLTGCSLANAGDFNGDGLEDLLLGTHGDAVHTGYSFGGMVSVVYGRASFKTSYDLLGDDPVDIDVAHLLSESEGGNLGYDLASLGDINFDGYDDIILGAPALRCDGCTSPEQTGRAYVVLGTPDVAAGGGTGRGLHGASRIDEVSDSIYEGVPGDWTGMSVDGAGFVGADYGKTNHPMIASPWLIGSVSLIGTAADFAYAVPWRDEYRLYVFPQYDCEWDPDVGLIRCVLDESGRPKPRQLRVALDAMTYGGHRFVGNPGESMGMEVHGPGDLDGDGIGDLAFGAPEQLTYEGSAGDGSVYLFAGH